ncbi:glycosyltransferase family 4 protein [Flagellimonas sp. 2504JD4-2]
MYPTSKTPYYGVFVRNLELNLSNLGLQFQVKSLIKGLERNKIRKGLKYLDFFFSICFNLFKFKQYDLIYLHYVPIAIHPLYLFKKLRPKVPLIINFHGGFLIDLDGKPKLLSSKVLSAADLFIVPSNFLKDFLVDEHAVDKNKIIVSPSSGVDTELFSPVPKSPENDIPVIGFFSRISEGKGWEVFIEALSLLKKQNIPFKAIMIGGGTNHAELMDRLGEFMITQNVEVVGAVSHQELPNYLNQLDVNVFPTKLYESLGLVGVEAMACGIPVIGSNIGGLKTYIKDGFNGYLFEVGSHSALYNKLLHYLQMPEEERKLMSRNALETAQEYDSKKVAEDLYIQLKSLGDA